ncbi:MAG: HAMP domain-containing sensor histidine kinase [Intestinibacter sp.]|uniref:sensor histidine kinase n=1 Tax=Intestinibacter sp. TaxID=1965304 RepID=UPI002A7F15FE|nr:HAMP domain-containing sensor histidine kinase [Intestinibacter sp.]MDY4573435.1 HAMP domain-containing sensor histidine kinase [Intestinibacter sp.]
MTILSNIEVKKFLRNYAFIFLVALVLCFCITIANLNIIKHKVVENNQAILGEVLTEHPELEDDIVDIITQSRSKENINSGAEILQKYNYDNSISISNEPIISESLGNIFALNLAFVVFTFIAFIILAFFYFRQIYRDIKDMTDYVYHNSEGRYYDMKDKNQEGQIGLLKVELMKMTTILKEKVNLLQNEKVFLNNTISDISHQLKTPMTSLIILNDLMYGDLDKEKRIEFLDKTSSQLSRMEWLIKSMLKLAKVEAKVIEFKTEKVNIDELIRKSISPMIIPMELKNISISIDGKEDASYTGDIEWSTEATTNIIKNCVEHTPDDGQIEISYEENPIYSEIVIKDNGEGIDKKDLPNIFRRFYKGKNSKSDSVGIGLAMAKSIVESQNGTIYVKSEKGVGSEFHIIFHKTYSD